MYTGCNTSADADGTTGAITVWNGGEGYRPSLGHEAGHLLAYKKWGSYVPPGYKEIWQAEGGVSEYGSTSPTEDFAEAMQHYVDGKPLSERKRAIVQSALNERAILQGRGYANASPEKVALAQPVLSTYRPSSPLI